MEAVASLCEHKNESVALRYILDAWEEALDDGISSDQLANAALFAALTDLVSSYGEEAVRTLISGLTDRLDTGEFSLDRTLQ
ncbi:MAG: hypothetical protein AAGJ70_07375 [Pseudomonadota bacterium]